MRFGRAHEMLTSTLAAFGILALVGTVPLPGLAPVQIIAELLVGAQLVVLATRRGARNDTALFTLALVHFLAATMFGGGLAFLVAFVGAALALPAAAIAVGSFRATGGEDASEGGGGADAPLPRGALRRTAPHRLDPPPLRARHLARRCLPGLGASYLGELRLRTMTSIRPSNASRMAHAWATGVGSDAARVRPAVSTSAGPRHAPGSLRTRSTAAPS